MAVAKKVQCWKVSLPCSRQEAEELAADSLFLASSDSIPTLVTRRLNDRDDDQWVIEIYCDAPPDQKFLADVAQLAPASDQQPTVEELADADWVTLSQQGLEPLRAGRFYVHASHDAPLEDRNIRNLCIDASRAFGTGHHETTMGCLRTLDDLRRRGAVYRNIADVGTGTGLLAFGANHLWPAARILASDIDPVAVEVAFDNGAINAVPIGPARGQVRLIACDGLDHAAYRRRAPFDLIVANILAGPLVALAPAIANAAAPGASLILAGLVREQQDEVVRAYRRAGFRLRRVLCENEWPCLLFVRATPRGRTRVRVRQSAPARFGFGEW